MAGIKIIDLPATPSAQLSDVFPISQSGVTYKESNQQVFDLFKTTGEALTKVDDTNVTVSLGGSPTTALLNATSMTMGWSGQLSVPRGGTGNSTFTAYSVICGGTTSTGAFQNVSGLGTSGQILTSNGPGLLPTWQTPAASGTVNPGLQNQLAWYAANGTTVSGLSTANNGVLVTSSGGVPSISSTLPASLNIPTPLIKGSNGFNVATFADAASTTDYLNFTSGTSNNASITLISSNSNGSFAVYGKGTGGVQIGSSGSTSVPMTLFNGTYKEMLNTSLLTADRTVTFPDASGTILLSGSIAATSFATDSGTATPSSGSITISGSSTGLTTTGSGSTVGMTGTLNLGHGGTNAALTASNGGLIYSTASALAVLSAGSSGQIPRSGGSGAPSWSTATYPASAGTSGNVLKSDGTNWNSATVASLLTAPTIQKFTSGSGTYTTPSPTPLYIKVQMVGGGGGGGGSGTIGGANPNGSAGGNTTFGTALLSAGGGGGGFGGGNSATGGAGGTSSLGGASGTAFSGADGSAPAGDTVLSQYAGGAGGNSFFGGGGASTYAGSAGGAGVTNTGGGGAGGASGAAASYTGLGGGAGGFVDAIISSPSATYSYAVGAGGAGASAGTSGAAGGAGGSGYIVVTEYYQ